MDSNFDNYWDFLKEHAVGKLGMKKGEWMKRSGLSHQRYSEFDSRNRSISVKYFFKLTGGAQLTPEKTEKESGIKFTKEQREELQFDAWVAANKKDLKRFMKNPKLWTFIKGFNNIK